MNAQAIFEGICQSRPRALVVMRENGIETARREGQKRQDFIGPVQRVEHIIDQYEKYKDFQLRQ
jgi:hypothetical protein